MLQGFSERSGVSEMEIKHQLATEYGIEPDEIKHSCHATNIVASDLNGAGLVAAVSSIQQVASTDSRRCNQPSGVLVATFHTQAVIRSRYIPMGGLVR